MAASKTYKVTVRAPKRDGYPGYYTAGQLVPHGGDTELEVDHDGMRHVLADSAEGRILIKGDEDSLRKEWEKHHATLQAESPTQKAELSLAERAELEQLRREKVARSVVTKPEPSAPAADEDEGQKGGHLKAAHPKKP